MTVARQLELAIPELENLMQPAWSQVMPVSLQRNTMVSITKFSSQKFIHKNEINDGVNNHLMGLTWMSVHGGG